MITIAQKLHPYSALPGTRLLIPGTTVRATIYPAKVVFHDLKGPSPQEIASHPVPIKGTVDKFFIELDLERKRVSVSGQAEGFFRYSIGADALVFEKGADATISLNFPSEPAAHVERLSLGCHKSQDWPQVMRRFSMDEVFPFWYRLAQLVPKQQPALYEGTASLLPACCKAIVAGDRTQLLKPFEDLLKAGFEGILSPRLTDDDHQGFSLKALKSDAASPLAMLVEGALLMRSLFIQTEGEDYKILPALPVDFHSGRMLHVRCGAKGFLDMEWSKKQIRRMVFHAAMDGEIRFQFSKELKSFRCHDKRLNNGDAIQIEKNKVYVLDRFEK